MRFITILLAGVLWTQAAAANDTELLKANIVSFDGAMSHNDYAGAVRYATEALRLGKLVYKPNDISISTLMLNLGDAELANQKHDEAIAAFDDAIALATAAGERGRTNVIVGLTSRARAISQAKGIEAGIREYAMLEDKAEELFGAKSREVAQVRLMRGEYILYRTAGPDPLVVRRLFMSAAEILESLEGNHSEELARVYHQIGKLRAALKNHRSAIEYYEKSLTQLKGKKKTGDELIVRASLIEALDRAGEYERCDTETQFYAVMLGEGDRSRAEPLVKYIPEYPPKAASMGREGSVVFSYGVNKHGHVVDPVVVKADPVGFFEQSALKAFKKWRYAPRVVGGEAVDSSGYEARIVYGMQD